MVSTSVQTQTHYFARDDRVYKAFVERIELHKGAIQRMLSRRLRWQLRVLVKVLEGRNTTYRVRPCWISPYSAIIDVFRNDAEQGRTSSRSIGRR
jgi:hypothetical protein